MLDFIWIIFYCFSRWLKALKCCLQHRFHPWCHEEGTKGPACHRPLYHYAGSLYSKKGFFTRRKDERILQSDEVISAQDLLITMMAFHGFTLLIHVIFFLLKDLENERLICICLCCQLPSWQHAVVVGVFNTIFGTNRKKIQDQPELWVGSFRKTPYIQFACCCWTNREHK